MHMYRNIKHSLQSMIAKIVRLYFQRQGTGSKSDNNRSKEPNKISQVNKGLRTLFHLHNDKQHIIKIKGNNKA